jgi:hypothetical protein
MRRALAILFGFATVASRATAAELVPGFEVDGAWDSNIFRSVNNEESAPSTLAGPNFDLREEQGSLLYDIQYRLRYEYFPTVSGINDFQHFVQATGSYRFNAATWLSVHENFTQASSAYQSLNSQSTTAGLVQTQQNARQELQVNDVGATLSHSWTPRWQSDFSFGYTTFDYPQNNQLGVAQSSSSSMVGSAQLTNSVTRLLTLGFGSSVTRQEFETSGGQQGRGTTIYNAFGIVNYQITPTLSFSASAGPAIDDPDQLNVPSQLTERVRAFPTDASGNPIDANSCPFQGNVRVLTTACQVGPPPPPTLVFDPSQTPPLFLRPNAIPNAVAQVPILTTNSSQVQPTLTYYGHVTLEKKWERITADLTYSRTASTASGLATSTNLDTVGASISWIPTNEWYTTVTASYNRQTAASKSQQPLAAIAPLTAPVCEVEQVLPTGPKCLSTTPFTLAQTVGITSKLVNDAFEFNSYTVQLNVGRKLSKRLTATTSLTWWQQTNSGQLQPSETRQDFRIMLGFTYTFTPIPLWTKDL